MDAGRRFGGRRKKKTAGAAAEEPAAAPIPPDFGGCRQGCADGYSLLCAGRASAVDRKPAALVLLWKPR